MKFPSYGAAGVLTLCLLSTSALANPTGLPNYSGKQGVTCGTAGCHSGGAAPTVEISGPGTLAAGATGQYSLIIRGGPAVVGGAGIAVSNTAAALDPATGSGLRKQGTELTHAAPKSFSSGEVRFDFSMIAPTAGGTVTLFGAGNSANGNQNGTTGNTGDGVATATLAVTVTGGTGGGTDGGTGGTDAGTGNGNEDEDKGGCSATGGAPMLVFALSALALSQFRRRS
jgi:uncharacterized protein (TIGR03382 family)